MYKPTILVVDNLENLLDSLRDYLEPLGYIVLTAKTWQEAIDWCQKEVVHLAVIDIRLEDDHDDNDWSGVLLAAALDRSISKILLTGAVFSDPVALVRNVLGLDEKGYVPADDFVWKREGPDRLLERIQLVFKTRVQLNTSLKLDLPRGLTWRLLVDQLKLFREASDTEKSRAEHVVEDLFRRLFPEASAVKFLRASPGYGPCTVAMVQPFFDGVAGIELAVKLGPRASIVQEVENYGKYVRPFIGPRSTSLWEKPVYSRELSAIAYNFIGEGIRSLEDLGAYYANKQVSDDALCKTLEDLFKGSCEKWYRANRLPAQLPHQPLDLWYREQLNLLEVSRVEELRATFYELIKQTAFGQLSLQLLSNGALQVQVNERPARTLPDPMRVAFEAHSNVNGSAFFPFPSRMAITHGDLHSGNILVSQSGRTWLIDFYRTGWGPALRDFAELESNITYDLVGTDSLRLRYDLEKALLAPSRLNEVIPLPENPSREQARAVAAIQQLRELAYALTDTEDAREYYMALLFYALRRVAGFASTGVDERGQRVPQYHALLSAAMICEKLIETAGS